MTQTTRPQTQVRIVPNDKGSPAGKLADAELLFGQDCPPLAGLKLVGFAVWQRRTGTGRNVTFPARAYSVNGERRTFALLRPTMDQADSDRIRDFILDAYRAYQDHGCDTYPAPKATPAQPFQAQAAPFPSFAPSLPVFASPAAPAETPKAAADSHTTTSPAEDLAL